MVAQAIFGPNPTESVDVDGLLPILTTWFGSIRSVCKRGFGQLQNIFRLNQSLFLAFCGTAGTNSSSSQNKCFSNTRPCAHFLSLSHQTGAGKRV